MGLQELWFDVIAALFLGFFILESFDFGVGMLMKLSLTCEQAIRKPTSALC